MMHEVTGKVADKTLFGQFEAVDILSSFDGPRLFTVSDAAGDLNLAYWSDSDGPVCRYVVVPTSERIIRSLKSGEIALWDALDQPRCWLVETQGDTVDSCLSVDFSHLPVDALPKRGVMLYRSLEPLLTLRALGDRISPGEVPGSVIRFCVEGIQKAIKVLSEFELGKRPAAGRPSNSLSHLFDLPTQRMVFGSFEISFRMPSDKRPLWAATGDSSEEAEVLRGVASLLKKGFNWLTQRSLEGGYPGDPEESAAILRALKELTPSSQGSIERLELYGQLLGQARSPVVLDKTSRKIVNLATQNLQLYTKTEESVGRIGELDKDRLSFYLRDIGTGDSTQRFIFSDDLLDDVFQAFEADLRVKVIGLTIPVGNLRQAIAIEAVDRPSNFDN